MPHALVALAALAALSGTRAATPSAAVGDARARVVAAARRHVGERFRGDCSTFVRRVYDEARVPLPASASKGRSQSEAMYRALAPARRPRPGDLAFFHRTYDRDSGAGRDLFTHVALVEKVEGSRVTLIHRAGSGIRRLVMNVARPADPRENGAVRRRRILDRPGTRYLAGELFAGYASAIADASSKRVARKAADRDG
jgi:NlpC/P60 family